MWEILSVKPGFLSVFLVWERLGNSGCHFDLVPPMAFVVISRCLYLVTTATERGLKSWPCGPMTSLLSEFAK